MSEQINIQEKVMQLVSETLKIDSSKIFAEAKFVEDLGADSLDQVELIMALEAAFDCEIPQEDAEKIASVSDVVQYLQKILAKNLDKKIPS